MLFFAIAYIASLVMALTRHSFSAVNFLTFSNAVFVTMVLPKIIGFTVIGKDIFLIQYGVTDDNAVIAAAYITFIFMIAINLAYIVSRPARFYGSSGVRPSLSSHQKNIVAAINLYLILPLSVVAIGIYFISADVSLDSLVSKRNWSAEEGGFAVYVSQKVAQFAKVGLFLAIFVIISGNRPSLSFWLQAVVFSVLLIMVYLSSSQRSGVLLLAITIILILHAIGRLKVKYIAVILGVFLVTNSVILASRFVDGTQNLNFFELIIRRYFFELEKISAIFEYSVSDAAYIFSPISGIFSTSSAKFPDYNIHYFIGYEMFGLVNFGIPPSILGEIILYLGPIFVFPVTFLIALFLARMERLLGQTRSMLLKVFLLLLLANSYFLLLNSDMLSLIKRTVFDSAFLFIAIFFVYLAKSGGNQSAGKEKL